MTFEYDDYFWGCFLFPLLFFLPFLAYIGGRVVRDIRKHWILIKKELAAARKFEIIITTVGCIYAVGFYAVFLSVGLGWLINGGMYLCVEKETDAIETTGVITEIKLLNGFTFHPTKSEYDTVKTDGYGFTVDGIRLISAGKGDLEVGDEVTVVYLPRSKYILSITRIEESDSSPPANTSLSANRRSGDEGYLLQRADTHLHRGRAALHHPGKFLRYCPKCKKEIRIDVVQLKMVLSK